MGHIVTSALVVARDTEGKHVYLYKGTEVPGNIPAAEVDRLAAEGFLQLVEPVVLDVAVPVVVDVPVGEPQGETPVGDDEPRRTRRARPAPEA